MTAQQPNQQDPPDPEQPQKEGQVDNKEKPQKQQGCHRWCQSRLCICAVFLVMVAGIAVTIPLVLVSDSVRDQFPPDQSWWEKGIVYQIYPASFQDSDDNGVGDLKGITSRLDYLQKLKVKAIWLRHLYPSSTCNSTYDVSNHTDVNPLLGTVEDFIEMVKECHKADIKVIIDFIADHTSTAHEWFGKSENRMAPYEDYYIWANATILPNGTRLEPSNWMSSAGHSAWQWSDTRQQFYYHSLLPTQPALNYRNPLVVEEMKKVLIFWLDQGVDGVMVNNINRLMVYENYSQDQERSFSPDTEWWDPAYYVTNLTVNRPEMDDIIQSWREELDKQHENDDSENSDEDTDNSKYLMADLGLDTSPEDLSRYYDYGVDTPVILDLSSTHDDLQSARHAVFCDAMCIRDVFQAANDSLPKGKWPSFVVSKEDNLRIASNKGATYVDAVNMLMLTLPGTPITYYGDEIGMQDVSAASGTGTTSRSCLSHSSMQWDDSQNAGFSNSSHTAVPINPDYTTCNVKNQTLSKKITSLQVYQELSTLREEASLRYGFLYFVDVTPRILSYLRSAEFRPQYLVVINLGNTTSSPDFSDSSVKADKGKVKVVTSDAANEGRFVKDETKPLTSLSLKPGDGVIFELPEESS